MKLKSEEKLFRADIKKPWQALFVIENSFWLGSSRYNLIVSPTVLVIPYLLVLPQKDIF